MEKYFAGEEIPEAELKAAIRKATINVDFYPMLAGSAFKNKGVQMMLDAVIDYLPSPLDIPAIQGVNPDTDEEDERPASDEEPFAALAFKIMTDPFVGRLSFFRVYSGTLDAGSYVLNTSKVNVNVSDVSFKCTLTLVKKSKQFTLGISLLLLV